MGRAGHHAGSRRERRCQRLLCQSVGQRRRQRRSEQWLEGSLQKPALWQEKVACLPTLHKFTLAERSRQVVPNPAPDCQEARGNNQRRAEIATDLPAHYLLHMQGALRSQSTPTGNSGAGACLGKEVMEDERNT